MTTKEELSQYYYKLKKVDEALEEYNKFKVRAEKMTAVLSDVPSRTNKTSDKVGDNAILMAELSKEYERRWREAEIECDNILNKINLVEEPYRTILYLRYIRGKRLEYIADELNYSYSQVKRFHGHALQVYEKMSHNELE